VLVEAVRKATRPAAVRLIAAITGATKQATRSGERRASAFGVSSPSTSETYAMTTMTRPSATGSAHAGAPGSGRRASQGISSSAAAAPPMTEASAPTNVMAIWIVARNVSGDSLSLIAWLAPGIRLA
jgi:hypothetical protein